MRPNPVAQHMMLESVNATRLLPVPPSQPLVLPSSIVPQPPAQPLQDTIPRTSSTPPDPALIEQVSQLDFPWDKAESTADARTIETNFSPDLNRDIGYNGKNRFDYTQRQRQATMAAIEALDIDHLDKLLTQQLSSGKRKNLKQWIEFDTNSLNGYVFSISLYLCA
jgi:hypothetical protein